MAGESLATCQLDDGWVCYGCGETFDGIAPWGMYCPAPLCREAYTAEFGEPYGGPCADHDALTVDVVRHSGGLVVTALVDDCGDRFYESLTFYGYDEDDARSQYVATITGRGYKIVTE